MTAPGWGSGWAGNNSNGRGFSNFRGGMRGNMMNVPYGYGNMMGGYNHPMNNMRGMRGGNQSNNSGRSGSLTLTEVKSWLERQQPFVLQTVMKTCTTLLVTKHDVATEDLNDWYRDVGQSSKSTDDKNTPGKSGTLLQGGVEPENSSALLKRDNKPGLGWTKSDIRHPHKVTVQMKPLPEQDIIPPFSAENKEADVDRDKRKMLTNNVSMMQMEVNKICHRFKIPPAQLDKDNLDSYPEKARDKLKVALTCVKNAETTLSDFIEFLKTDKYKEWNDEQKAKREELLKSMIGEEPKGRPHAGGVKEDNIELIEATFDEEGRILGKDQLSRDELEAEPLRKISKLEEQK